MLRVIGSKYFSCCLDIYIYRYAEVALDEAPEWRHHMMKFFQVAANEGDAIALGVLAVYRANFVVDDMSFVVDRPAM